MHIAYKHYHVVHAQTRVTSLAVWTHTGLKPSIDFEFCGFAPRQQKDTYNLYSIKQKNQRTRPSQISAILELIIQIWHHSILRQPFFRRFAQEKENRNLEKLSEPLVSSGKQATDNIFALGFLHVVVIRLICKVRETVTFNVYSYVAAYYFFPNIHLNTLSLGVC